MWAIDFHNRHRQHELGLEKRRTTDWKHRFFQTFIGILVNDTRLAYTYNTRHRPEIPDAEPILTFALDVAHGLLSNLMGGASEPLRLRLNAPFVDGGAGASSGTLHALQSLGNHPLFVSLLNKRKRCSMPECTHSRGTYCPECSVGATDRRGVIALCSPYTGRSCVQDFHNILRRRQQEEVDTPPPRRRNRRSDDTD